MNSAGHTPEATDAVSSFNVPNALTTVRLLCVPVLAVLLACPSARWWCAGLFVLASAPDLVDGALARRYGQVTTFGKIADPIADKALTGVALMGLSFLGELWWWVTILVLVREVGVTLLRLWMVRIAVIPASRGGKAKTLAQMVAITMFLIPVAWSWWLTVSDAVMAAAVLLTLATGLDYVITVARLRVSRARPVG
ncbi:MAG: CDP-diacylglycerol--glycerol-3-phosphate 3-phosphatidyltransferase [Candidatus Nanopelagicales bacterium]|nr:CDP-diacylglycerol--glycerol-3-phosphate 3-phosphatidyltransferase [Candidatus Nanopelagicales bacterium]